MNNIDGIETIKAVNNWGRGETPGELVKAYGEVKKSALLAINKVSNRFEPKIFSILLTVLDEIIAGQHNSSFVIPLKQGGAGTSLNMNMNEVIAKQVNNRIDGVQLDFLEDINMYQSTNDTLNCAVTIIFLRKIIETESYIIELQELLVSKEQKYSNLLMTGRTELMGALPMTLGQLFSSYAGSIERDRWRFNKIKERIRPSVLGGTAIGTSFGAPANYVFEVEKELRRVTGLSVPRSQNMISDISMADKLVEAASSFDVLGNTLFKIASDFMLYIFNGEMTHPEFQYGSSIMPMKVNPVLLEFVKGLSIDISLECRKIGEFARNGQLQLNPYIPFILESGLSIAESILKAINSMMIFIRKVKINETVISENLNKSQSIINSLRPYCNYNDLKEISRILEKEQPKSIEEIIEIIVNRTNLDRNFLKEYMSPGGFTSFFKENKI